MNPLAEKIFNQNHLAKNILSHLDSLNEIYSFSNLHPILRGIAEVIKIDEEFLIVNPMTDLYIRCTVSERKKEILNSLVKRMKNKLLLNPYKTKFSVNNSFIIRKTFKDHCNPNNPVTTSFEIDLPSRDRTKRWSFKREIEYLKNLNKYFLESVTRITTDLNIETNQFPTTCLNSAAAVVANYYNRLFKVFPSHEVLNFDFLKKGDKTGFLFRIIKNISSENLKEIETINMYDTLKFLENYRGSNYQFFSHLKNLKVIRFELYYCYYKIHRRITNLNDFVPIILDIRKIPNCKIIFHINCDIEFLSYIENLYSFSINWDILFEVKSTFQYRNKLFRPLDNLIKGVPVPNVFSVAVGLTLDIQCNNFFRKIDTFINLKFLDVTIDLETFRMFIRFDGSKEEVEADVSKLFSFKDGRKFLSVESMTLEVTHFSKAPTVKNGLVVASNFIYKKFLELASNKIVELQLISIDDFSNETAELIAENCPKLEYLYLGVKRSITDKSLSILKCLKKLTYNSTIKTCIPKDIELCIYLPAFRPYITMADKISIDDLNTYITKQSFEMKNELSKNFNHKIGLFGSSQKYYLIFFNLVEIYQNSKRLLDMKRRITNEIDYNAFNQNYD